MTKFDNYYSIVTSGKFQRLLGGTRTRMNHIFRTKQMLKDILSLLKFYLFIPDIQNNRVFLPCNLFSSDLTVAVEEASWMLTY